MVDISHVRFSETLTAERWDAEYFRPRFRSNRDLLAGVPCERLDAVADIFDGNHVSMSNYFVEKGIRYLRGQDLSDFFISDEQPIYIPASVYQGLSRSHMKEGDVLVGIVGTLGTVGLVTDKYENLTGNCKLAILRTTAIEPACLAVYLASDIGQKRLLRSARGAVQAGILLPDLRAFPIPRLLLSLQTKIADRVKGALRDHKNSQRLYPEAEQELLERLGWEKIRNRPNELFFVEKLSEATRRGRVDAEHFQPKYLRLQERLKAACSRRLGDFCPTPSRGMQPVFVPDGDVWVLASKAIRPQGVALDEEGRTSRAYWEDRNSEKARVRAGDVLLNSTGVGTLGRASFYLDEAAALADNHVAILRPNEAVCLSVYLSLFLNSAAGLWQSEMFQTGSSGQLEIYPQHIQDIRVFVPRNKDGSIDLSWQRKLADKVTGASRAKQEARTKLSQAKKLVEDHVAKAAAR